MRNTLLTIHVLSVVIWLGCGLYEIFVARELKAARGTPREVEFARLYLKYAAPVPVATLVVAGTGVWMAIALHFGFFQLLWLGVKQSLMIGVLIIFAAIVPMFLTFKREVDALPPNATQLSADAARRFARLEPWLITMRVMGTIAVVFAIWRPV